MKKYFIVTIDTEGDDQWDANLRRNTSLRNLKEIPKLQKLFDKFEVKPAYLLTYPAAKDKYSCSMFKEFLSGPICEIGSHLHSWSTPPIFDNEAEKASFLHWFPKSSQKEKFNNLHNAIVDNLCTEPRSYRGGKYSFDTNALELLEEKRYLLDTSVTPFHNWSHIGGPDYVDPITEPYFLSRQDILKKGKSSVLEVPVSIDFDKTMSDSLKRFILRIPLAFHAQGILKKLGLCKLIWLDPSFQTFPEMKRLIDLLLAKRENPCINLMFHSPVILAGGTPYNITDKDVSNFYHKLESILEYLINERGVENLMPKDLAAKIGERYER